MKTQSSFKSGTKTVPQKKHHIAKDLFWGIPKKKKKKFFCLDTESKCQYDHGGVVRRPSKTVILKSPSTKNSHIEEDFILMSRQQPYKRHPQSRLSLVAGWHVLKVSDVRLRMQAERVNPTTKKKNKNQ
jgi:hypothetical protein